MPHLHHRAWALGACLLYSCSEPIVLGQRHDGAGGGEGGGGDAGSVSCQAPRPDFRVGDGEPCDSPEPGFAFTYGLCTCGDLVGNDRLELDAIESCAGVTSTKGGSIGVNGFSSTGPLSLGGSLIVAGTRGIELNVPQGAAVSFAMDLQSGGDLTGAGHVKVGGDADVAGDVDVERLQVSGALRQPADKTLKVQEGDVPERVETPVTVSKPCVCDGGPDLTAVVQRLRGDNDNASIDLDPTGLDSPDAPIDVQLPEGDYALERLLAAHPVRVTVEGAVTLAIAGDILSEPGGSLEFVLDAEASLDLIVAGAVTLADTLDLGDAESAGRARLYVGTNGTVNLAGTTTVAGPFYAPGAEVVVSGKLEVYGALLSRTFRYASPVTIHYDQALAGTACE